MYHRLPQVPGASMMEGDSSSNAISCTLMCDAMAPNNDAPAPNSMQKQVSTCEPWAHRLPSHVMWGITMATAIGMALLNLCTITCMRKLVRWKFHLMQSVTDEAGVGFGAGALICAAAFLATCCMSLIFIVDPDAGSSGAPENRGWLNGNNPGNFFTLRSLVVRGLATILGNAAGYPVGREGPTVTMGSNLAFLITDRMVRPYARQWVDVDTSGAGRSAALVVDEERIAAAKRIACAVGGACGMAMIFDAPIGGILYMFEEVSAHCWPMELTFRAFVGTITCALMSRAMLNLSGTDTKAFVLYEWSPQRHPWDWWDLPVMVLIAAVLGPFSSIHTRVCLQVGSYRQAAMKSLSNCQPYAKVLEAIAYAAICATVCALTALMGRCEPLRPGDSPELVRYNCNRGYYNPVASLLLTTSEGAVNLLFSRRDEGVIHPVNAMLALCAYTSLNIGLTGVPAPSGNFTGTMLIGGLVGRILGSIAGGLTLDASGAAASGVYAMVGSAAMLCGFKRMSLAVVWFVSIASNDFNIVPPLMLSVVVSLILARACKERGYDEEQVLRRNVPFLEAEPPHGMDSMCAADLCDPLPEEARLAPEATTRAVSAALRRRDLLDFPVIRDGGICIGFTTRGRLEAVLRACAQLESDLGADIEHGADEVGSSEEGEMERLVSDSLANSIGALAPSAKLPVGRLVDPVPYTILEEMPAPRCYALFAKAGVNTASVVSDAGVFKGMITRNCLIKLSRKLEEEEEHKRHQ